MPRADQDALKLDYEQTLATFRLLVEVRFKLLAFVPTVSGAAIALLGASELEREKTVLAAIGLVVTFAILLYDQRNTQFHNGAISRARHLEGLLELPAFEFDKDPGLSGSRGSHRRLHLWLLPIGHDLALALVYSSVLAGWTAVLCEAAGASWAAALAVCAVVGVLTLVQLLGLDASPSSLKSTVRRWLRGGGEKRSG